MALADDTNLDFHSDLGIVPDRSMALLAAAKPWKGSALGRSGGYVRPLVAGDVFAGFAQKTVDNTNGSSGDLSTPARREGMVKVSVAGVTAISNEGANVYMSDDGTFTLTLTSNSLIGRIEKWESGTTCWVHFWGDGTKP